MGRYKSTTLFGTPSGTPSGRTPARRRDRRSVIGEHEAAEEGEGAGERRRPVGRRAEGEPSLGPRVHDSCGLPARKRRKPCGADELIERGLIDDDDDDGPDDGDEGEPGGERDDEAALRGKLDRPLRRSTDDSLGELADHGRPRQLCRGTGASEPLVRQLCEPALLSRTAAGPSPNHPCPQRRGPTLH